MAKRPLRQFGSPGVTANTAIPDSEQLYITPQELLDLYGMAVNEGHVRFAMSLVNKTVNRPSLWVEEYEERLNIPSDRSQAVLSYTPVQKIISAAGRYGYGRRDRRSLNQVNYDYLAAIAVFGSPPQFTAINVDQIDLYGPTGEIWLPTGFFLINYTQIQIKYLAGFTDVPDRVKAAMAEIINTIRAKGVADRVSYTVGTVARRYDSAGFVSDTAYGLLEPYIVRALF